ncbi:MAG: protein translocase subunit SecF [Bacteriovoracaceae bacterium]
MKFNIDFVGNFKIFGTLSALMIIGILVMFFTKGLNYGVDFRGGAEIQVKFKQGITLTELREKLEEANIPVSQVQTIGEESANEFLMKIQSSEQDLNKVSAEVSTMLNDKLGDKSPEILKNDIVGPKAGAQLRLSGFQAMAWALLGIMIYIALRFEFKFAPGAIIALFHDVTIIIGAFLLTQKEFSLQIVAALLAIIGYSINDTVVIYDRVREIEEANPAMSIKEVVNRAINETMSRTIITAMTTFIVAVVMFLMGGGVIHDFFFAMSIGIIAGTYSTVYIAVPMTILFSKKNPQTA